ncbi:MAG: bifunctional demethylmenaquinone methyltransferase/2-methoxy-6-polyprenyl-1,4-benzoquinol methylase UbiE [Cytophagaceae bacterium]
MQVLPYKDKNEGKKQQVATMFNNISQKYDLLNRVLSIGIDKKWRRRAIDQLISLKPDHILDVATGTGDLAIEALRLNPVKIIGVDISEGMLEIGKEKIFKKGISNKIELRKGDSEQLDFPENTFDAVTVAFGVRNFEDLEKGLKQIYRVLKPGGKVVILEFSQPEKFPFKQIYNIYSKFVLPGIGRLISKDKGAYSYLPESVSHFPYGKAFLQILENTGFKSPQCKTLTFGISSIYTAIK